MHCVVSWHNPRFSLLHEKLGLGSFIQYIKVFILTCLILFEAFEASRRTIFANKKIIHHKWNQFSQLIANAGFMVPAKTAGTQKFYNVQVTILATVCKQETIVIITNNVFNKNTALSNNLDPTRAIIFHFNFPKFEDSRVNFMFMLLILP